MGRYVPFLRGMNLGGRRIKNEELRRHFEEMEFEEVATFRASGNVISIWLPAQPSLRPASLSPNLKPWP